MDPSKINMSFLFVDFETKCHWGCIWGQSRDPKYNPPPPIKKSTKKKIPRFYTYAKYYLCCTLCETALNNVNASRERAFLSVEMLF